MDRASRRRVRSNDQRNGLDQARGWLDSLRHAGRSANVAGDYIAVVETSVYGRCACVHRRIPTGFWSVFKSTALSMRNPLVLRENPTYGVGAILLAGDHIRQFPFENAILYAELGFAVADRVGAAICQVAGGAYTSPTIS